ncbi:tigger transposable element-derived protein 1 [Lasius niger]|uniref:Tigger transposable element-derived protein 1 n=1 Tax=Lasius niger TaxID=67767 RepID=A0A0J7K828_LASNI|nr:tigger transposable element-derived protein 1 [Lasius niger]
MGYLKASTYFNVPRTMLFRLTNGKETSTERLSKKIGRKPIFNEEFEKQLDYILVMEAKFYGLTQLETYDD